MNTQRSGRFGRFFIVVLLLGIFIELLVVIGIVKGHYDPKGNIGIVKVEGTIMSSEAVIHELKKFEEQAAVKVIVLRVNSPGGTVAASQEIHDEVVRVAKKKKIVVSMGDLAASGGYYLAAPATRIIANPGTITGSIGVVAQYLVFEDLLKRYHLKWEVLKAGDKKDMGSPFKSLSAEERRIFQDLLTDTHEQFILAIAKGRGLEVDRVRALSDGRVISGARAQELGLVDELGGLEHAIEVASKLVGIANADKKPIYPSEESLGWFKRWFAQHAANIQSQVQVEYKL